MTRTHKEDRIVYTVEEVAKLLGIGLTPAYAAVKAGQLPTLRIGRRIVIPRAAFDRWLETAGKENTSHIDV